MRSAVKSLLIILCVSCTQLPVEIPNAPEEHAKLVVFDIDGTLTPSVVKFWKARNDAAKAVNFHARKGRKIIYLSARVLPLQSGIPEWLKENDFPEGSIHVTESANDAGDHAQFKTRILKDFVAHGWEVDYAYGDSSSDFEAYAAAGIPRERVFALRREGDSGCQPGTWQICLNGWTEHIDALTR